MTSLIAGPCFNFLSKTIETCKSQKSKLDMEKIVMKSDSVRREKERLLKKRENSEEGSGKDDTRKPREIDLSSRNDGVALLDTTWLLKQYHKKPQVFNLMSVGETGIGKSTLMDTLFNTHFDSTPSTHELPGVKLRSHTYELAESNVKLKLAVVDTVGFGDQIDKTDSYKAIVDYIDAQFEAYLQEELKVKRSMHTYHDSRIHACLYFIAPTGHSLKALDLVTMKALDNKVNIIPIIAKADTITKQELHKFKLKVMSELVSNGVRIYQFPVDDETVAEVNSSMNGHLPFAVVGSMDEVKVGNKMVKARQYPWGTVQVENENHCDFVKLREMLVRTNMEDLRETTHLRHYELYRKNKLQEMGFTDNESMSLQETYEQKRSEHLAELQKKEEEMRQMFVVRVKEKETELKESEKDLHAKFDQLKKQHADEKKRLDDSRRQLEEERQVFEKRKMAAVAAQQATIGKKGKK